MHIFPVVPSYVRYPHILRTFLAKLREALTPIEDQWTLTTEGGVFFEEVEVENIEADEVIFHHKFGKEHLPIARLSEDSRRKLVRGYQVSDHPQSSSTEVKTVGVAKKAGEQGKVSQQLLLRPTLIRSGLGHFMEFSIASV